MQPESPVCECGNAKGNRARYCRACRLRWARAGYPDSGPPPPVSPAESARRAVVVRENRKRGIEPADPDAEYDTMWATVLEPQRRIQRANPVAECMARCVAASDAEGVSRLLAKYPDRHPALLIVLAATANPFLTRIVAREAPERKVRRAALVAGHLIAAVVAEDRNHVGSVLVQWVRTWDDYASLAVVLAECHAPVQEASRAA